LKAYTKLTNLPIGKICQPHVRSVGTFAIFQEWRKAKPSRKSAKVNFCYFDFRHFAFRQIFVWQKAKGRKWQKAKSKAKVAKPKAKVPTLRVR